MYAPYAYTRFDQIYFISRTRWKCISLLLWQHVKVPVLATAFYYLIKMVVGWFFWWILELVINTTSNHHRVISISFYISMRFTTCLYKLLLVWCGIQLGYVFLAQKNSSYLWNINNLSEVIIFHRFSLNMSQIFLSWFGQVKLDF